MTAPKKITVTTARCECFMCPTVIVGITDDGSTIYCRYRWGRLVIRLDPRDPAPHGGAAGVWILDKQLDPEGIYGCLSYDELRELTANLIEWPAEILPKCFDDDDAWLEL